MHILLKNFRYGIISILISPRRWGKSSLVAKASDEIEKSEKKNIIIKIALFKIPSEESFYEELAEKVIIGTSGKITETSENVSKFFKKVILKVSFSPGPDMEFSLDTEEVLKQPDEIFNLGEQIARSKNNELTRIKGARIEKEIIDHLKGNIYILDPIYKAWLERVYFKKEKLTLSE